MRRSGELVQWNDERGFGFVRDNDGKRYFVHITDIRRTETRPQQGYRVTFDPATGGDGRPVAKSAVLMGVAPRPQREEVRRGSRRPVAVLRIAMSVVIIFAAIAASQLRLSPNWVPIAYLVLGIVSMGLYWFDKNAAENGEWRIRESSLHLADLLGGVAGGLLAQALLRHKVRKPAFSAFSWVIAVAHLLALVLLLLGVWDFPPGLWSS